MGKIFLHDQSQTNDVENAYGGRLTVICSYGLVVKAVCGSLEYVAVADDTNKAIFDKLHQGTWEISLDDPNMIASKTVEIVTDYEVVIDFFSGTIVVEYPENSVCTCTNGIVTYTAPDVSGIWYCSIYDTGTWTISCTDGTQTKSRDIVVHNTDYYVNVMLSYFTATINVTYPAGAICTCSNGNILYSASNSTGSWSFTVYKAGDWTISASDGMQTVENTVNVRYDGQVESTTIKFFKSTINITYPAGATCTCTDGVTSFTAPNTSGNWTVTVPRTGEWTIRAFKDKGDVTQTVNITYDGQTATVLCEFFVAYINVTYPKNTFKTVLWLIGDYGVKDEIGNDMSGTGKHVFYVEQIGTYEVGIYRVSPYAGIESEAKDYASETVTIGEDKETANVTINYVTVPEMTYTGTYKLTDDNGNTLTSTDGNWNIQFLTGGNLVFTKLRAATKGIDVFACGGGGNGGYRTLGALNGYGWHSGGGGGGGGYCANEYTIKIIENKPYEITVGGAGGASSGFGVTANGGSDGGSADGGGAGGDGGTTGGKGASGDHDAGSGTDGKRAFSASTGYRYGASGGGGNGYYEKTNTTPSAGSGGKDGGGAGGGGNGVKNSGGGGGGQHADAYYGTATGYGGSGIVIIRNTRYGV